MIIIENFIERDGEEVFKEEFLEFAGYNLQRRAIPDARDGLKWGARQLIYSQALGGFTHDKPFKKAVKSVAQAMGFCYVHGDASAYGTFIRMAKPFAYRYVLQEANGNYGTLINPDDHSASRYVELRGSELSAKLLEDIDKDTIIEWEDTYDLEGQFPKVLPSKGFYGAINGAISIGSGMSCSIPPTNLKEVNGALIKLLNNPNISDDEIICYPDFPTGATILNKSEVKESMLKGYGFACKVRASVEYNKQDNCLIVTEMPYSTYTNTVCNELAQIITDDENCGIKDFVDYTGKKPDLRIYLAKGANPSKVLKRLYKDTSLQTHFTINMVMLDNGTTPKVFGWREMLQAHLNHEKIVYRRGFEYDIRKMSSRKHILDGYLICLARIEEVVQTIKKSSSTNAAKENLIREYILDDEQATAVLKLTLSRLAHLEVEKISDERDSLIKEIERLTAILNDEQLLNKEIEKGLVSVMKKFGDDRRTVITDIEKDESEEPIEIRSLQVSLTNKNNLFCTEVSSLYTQRRGGVGNKLKLDKDEFVVNSNAIESADEILLFTTNGTVYHTNAISLNTEDKTSIYSIVPIKDDEKCCAMTAISKNNTKQYICFITKKGYIKKTDIGEYNTRRQTGLKALTLEEGDEIVSVLFINSDNIGLLTENGNYIIITTEDVRAIGRAARGVHAIKLSDDDFVIAAHTIPSDTKFIASISSSGLFKKTPMSEFGIQGKNTKGAKIQKTTESDYMADFMSISSDGEILVASTRSCIKLTTNDIPTLSKGAQGIKSIKLGENDSVIQLIKY